MPLTDNTRGALYMAGTTVSFTLGDTCIKLAAEGLPLFQVIFLRGLLATALLWVVAWRSGALRSPVPRGDRRLIALRSLTEFAGMVTFFLGLTQMPLANATAILQALPLVLTLAAAVFLGEPVGWRRLVAIGIGFIGVLLIVRPGTAGFNAASLLILATVVLVTIRDLTMRCVSRGIPLLLIAAIMAAVVTTGAGALSLLQPWQAIAPGSAPLIAAAGVCIVGGYLFSGAAMRWGEIAFVTPFRYLALAWALILGWLVFGDWPAPLTLVGGALVIGTGLFTLYRERRAGRPLASAKPSRF